MFEINQQPDNIYKRAGVDGYDVGDDREPITGQPPQPYVPITSPTAITDMLFQEYGENPRCGHCNGILPPKALFGIPVHHRAKIEQIVRHAIVFYQRELDREKGVKNG